MIRYATRAAAISIMLLHLAALIQQASAAGAPMKGLSTLSQELSSRIATPDRLINLSNFMPGEGLEALAGTW